MAEQRKMLGSSTHEDSERVPEGASGGASCVLDARQRRWSWRRKREAVMRLLRGETLETLSRECGVTAATLSSWRDDFLAGGEAGLKSRQEDIRDVEIKRLRTKLGEVMMVNELLSERERRRGQPLPFAPRRLRG